MALYIVLNRTVIMKTFFYTFANNQLSPSSFGDADTSAEHVRVGIGVRYLVGDNARENHEIIGMSSDLDVWVHIKDLPSCHVIASVPVQCDTPLDDKRAYREMIRKVTRHGGVLCRQYSQNTIRSAGLSKRKVDMIAFQVRNIERTSVPGQVITRGDAMVFSV